MFYDLGEKGRYLMGCRPYFRPPPYVLSRFLFRLSFCFSRFLVAGDWPTIRTHRKNQCCLMVGPSPATKIRSVWTDPKHVLSRWVGRIYLKTVYKNTFNQFKIEEEKYAKHSKGCTRSSVVPNRLK